MKSICLQDIVLDPFMGTGFVLIACKELNRRFIGIEKDSKYCAKAERRLMNTMESLF